MPLCTILLKSRIASFSLIYLTLSGYLAVSVVMATTILQTKTSTVNLSSLLVSYASLCGTDYMCNKTLLPFSSFITQNYTHLNLCPTCACDQQCLVRGNCCPDVYFRLPPLSCRGIHIMDARNITQSFRKFYIVDTCPEDTDLSLVQLCTGNVSLTKKLLLSPVTSRGQPSVTYLNRHCAKCNSVHNYSEWNLDLGCDLFADFNFLSSYEEIIDLANERQCIVTFDFRDNLVPVCKSPEYISDADSHFHRCNITGTWTNSDPDIQKACESPYHLEYGDFKNVFCYICNPPRKMQQKVSGKCNETGMWKPFDQGLQSVCLLLPEIVATFPFKNIFCYLCNRNTLNSDMFLDVVAFVSRHALFSINRYTYIFRIPKYRFDFMQMVLNRHGGKKTSKTEKVFRKVIDGNQSVAEHQLLTHKTENHKLNMPSLMLKSIAVNGQNICNRELLPVKFRSFELNKCGCEIKCFPTCCNDFALTYPVTCINENISKQGKEQIGSTSFLAVNGCYRHGESNVFKELCSTTSIFLDIFRFLPLSTTSGSFRNVYCYICNQDKVYTPKNISQLSFSEVQPWSIEIVCDSHINYVHFLEFYRVVDAALNMSCRVKFLENDGIRPIMSDVCDMYEYDIGKCNVTGIWSKEDTDVRWACENTEPYRMSTVHKSGIIFKNQFCLMCNPELWNSTVIDNCNVTGNWLQYHREIENACHTFPEVTTHYPFKNIFCKQCNMLRFRPPGTGSTSDINEAILPPPTYPNRRVTEIDVDEGIELFNFRNLFALSEFDSQNDSSVRETCQRNQFYDQLQNVCRNLTCYPGKVFNASECIPLLPETRNLRYVMAVKLTTFLFHAIQAKDILQRLVEDIPVKLRTLLKIPPSDFQIYRFDLLVDKPCDFSGVTNNSSRTEVLIYLQFFISAMVPRLKTEEALVDFMSQRLNISLNTEEIISMDVEKSDEAMMTPILIHEKNFVTNCRISNTKNNFDGNPIVRYRTVNIADLLLCPQLEFNSNEYETDWSRNKLTLKDIGLTLGYEEFQIVMNGNARVCVDRVSEYLIISKRSVESTEALAILTFVCVIISLLCLLCTFFTYCIFTKLRTVPGKNNMCLIFALFCAQSSMLIQSQGRFNNMACLLAGICVHYFWLSAFGCLVVCSFHMCRVFSGNFKVTLAHSNKDSTGFKPVLFSYGIPAIFVATNISVSLGFTSGQETGYGGSSCFITNKISFIVTVLVPLILMCLSSITFFLYTAYNLKMSPKIQRNTTDRLELSVYLKLFVVTGSTWLVQILDSFLPLSFLSYVAAVLNGSQGLFIFLSYVCNRRVLRMYQNLRSGSANTSDVSDKTTSSGSTQKISLSHTSTKM